MKKDSLAESPAVVSVTSDTAINNSGPPAPAKPVKTERLPAPDSFASMIGDSGAEAAGNDRASTARDQPAPRRRADDAGSESRTPRDATSSRAQTRADAADDNSKAARPGRGDISSDVEGRSKPAKAGEAKTGGATSDTGTIDTSDSGNAADQAASPTVVDLTVDASAVVAVAIPVAVAPAAISAVPVQSVSAQAPLAIAAAALANASATNGSQAALAPSANPIPDTATALSGSETTADEVAGLGIEMLSNAVKADGVSAMQPATSSDGIAITGQQAAAAAAVATGMAKTGFNATGAVRPGAQANSKGPVDDSSAPLQSTDKTANAQRSVTDGKSDPTGVILPAKPEPSTANAPIQFSASSHEHTEASAPASVQADLSASGIQATNSFQQPQPAIGAPDPLTVTVATSAAVPLNALALQIAATAQSGKSRFEIRLDPAELGRIDVRIDIDRQGQMTSHLTVEKPETLAMLRQDAPQLQRALDDAGFKTGNSGLQFSLRDQSSSGQNTGNDSARHGQRLIIGHEDTVPATTAGRTYGRMLTSSGGVDIRV